MPLPPIDFFSATGRFNCLDKFCPQTPCLCPVDTCVGLTLLKICGADLADALNSKNTLKSYKTALPNQLIAAPNFQHRSGTDTCILRLAVVAYDYEEKRCLTEKDRRMSEIEKR